MYTYHQYGDLTTCSPTNERCLQKLQNPSKTVSKIRRSSLENRAPGCGAAGASCARTGLGRKPLMMIIIIITIIIVEYVEYSYIYNTIWENTFNIRA